jgi:hypothetical protein
MSAIMFNLINVSSICGAVATQWNSEIKKLLKNILSLLSKLGKKFLASDKM